MFNTSFKNITLVFVGNMLLESSIVQGNAKVPLLGRYDKEIMVRFPDLKFISKEMMEAVGGYKIKLAVMSAFAGIIAGCLCFLFTKMPERYIMPRTAFEDTGDIEETYYLSAENDLPLPGDMVLGYVDLNTEMVPFSGNIAVVERFRNTVCKMVAAVFFTYTMGSIFLWVKASKKTGCHKKMIKR